MQQTCLAYFGNMRIGKFAAPDTHVLRSGEAQYMSQTLMQLDTIKCGEHIWPNEKARASWDLTSKNLAGPVTFQISLFYTCLPVCVRSLASDKISTRKSIADFEVSWDFHFIIFASDPLLTRFGILAASRCPWAFAVRFVKTRVIFLHADGFLNVFDFSVFMISNTIFVRVVSHAFHVVYFTRFSRFPSCLTFSLSPGIPGICLSLGLNPR